MAQIDALRLTGNVRRRMVDFAVDDHFVRDERLAEICRSIWAGAPEQGGLISDLWVEGAFPSKASPHSLNDLVRQGGFSSELRDVLDKSAAVPGDRKLYTHQYEAITRAQSETTGNRPSLVVTAGTGAGKTEAFLLPILNDLYRDPPQERHGAKCIILYPMNALVNDQVDRLYDWLKGQHRGSLFHFTSETPEDNRGANYQGILPWDPCRMRTRQEARGLETHDGKRITDDQERGPTPDIIITNYSMLEYMLCRPQDSVFFGPALRTIVLDEAHLYTGTLAAEITLLLRRLLLRCRLQSENILQIATSATLGTGDAQELQSFAAQIFSKPPHLVHVITGEPEKAPMMPAAPSDMSPTADDIAQNIWPDGSTIVEGHAQGQQLADDTDMCMQLRERLPLLVAKEHLAKLDRSENRPAVLLHHSLAAAPLIQQLEDILWERKHIPLIELGERLFGESGEQATEATAQLLKLAASARLQPASYPLVPHRIHVMVKPAQGLAGCLNQECSGPDERRLGPLGVIMPGYREICEYCEHRALTLCRCGNCGTWLLAGHKTDGKLTSVLRADEPTGFYSLSGPCGSKEPEYIDPATGEWRGSDHPSAIQLWKHPACPNCQGARNDIRLFSSGTPLTLSILSETLLAEMPEFSDRSGSSQWLPGGGRRLLAFSDSRREAARLGPLLTNQHESQVVRSAIVEAVEKSSLVADPEVMDYLRIQIDNLKAELKSGDLSDAMRRRKGGELQNAEADLANSAVGGSVEMWAGELEGLPLLSQALDRPGGEKHQASKWNQLEWEANLREIKAQSLQFLGRELIRGINRWDTTLEGLGLIEVTYPGLERLEPPPEFLGTVLADEIRQALNENWTDILASLCDTLRGDGVVTLGNDDLDDNYSYDRNLIGRWSSARESEGPRLIRFVGATNRQRRRRFLSAVLRRCPRTNEDQCDQISESVLLACYNQLLEAAQSKNLTWLIADSRQVYGGTPVDAIRIDFSKLGLRHPPSLFRCGKTGQVWPRSVLGCAPNAGCDGTLEIVTHEALDVDPKLARRRREYRESAIFRTGLWAEEHSAQLDPKENRRLQDLFKSGIRNILSATTTLELGIDIGGLNGVLMSNVPPGKANYLQRAGRAGRRADGSSIVATFSRPRPFDQEVFREIGKYLSAELRHPVVFLDRERVVRRHLNSFLLNEFFRIVQPDRTTGAMDAFGRMGSFCGATRPEKWNNGPKPSGIGGAAFRFQGAGNHPQWWVDARTDVSPDRRFLDFLTWLKSDAGSDSYREPVDSLLEGASDTVRYESWDARIQRVIADFSEAVGTWRTDYDQLLEDWKTTSDKARTNALFYQLDALHELTVIAALADRQFLPRYGFPIDVLKLGVIEYDENSGRRIQEGQYKLERTSLLALREYVPGSQLVVGGKLVTSHGVRKHWTGENIDTAIGLRGRYAECIKGHPYYWLTGDLDRQCTVCGESPKEQSRALMFPQYGFSSAWWDPPKWSTQVEYVGQAETVAKVALDSDDFRRCNDFGGVEGLLAFYKEDGELLVYNRGEKKLGFALCLKCGYADSETSIGEGTIALPSRFANHFSLFPPRRLRARPSGCWSGNTNPVLRNQTMAARQLTDVLLLDFSACLANEANENTLVTTLGYALKRAAAEMLELDGREIGVLATPAGENGARWGALLYDNVPGGAGHVRELLEMGREWLVRAKDILFIDDVHNKRCRSACLDCLLSFETQDALQQGNLDRPSALAVLSQLLNGGYSPVANPHAPDEGASNLGNPTRAQQLTTEERQTRAQAKTPNGSG